MEELFFFLDI